MAHNSFVMPSGKWATVAPPKMLSRLDQRTSESINGDEGGTWNPQRPIALGPLTLQVGASTFTGGVRTGRGYTPTSKPRILLAPSKWPLFSAPRERSALCASWSSADGVRLDRNGVLHADDGFAHTLVIPSMRLHHGATLAALVVRWRLQNPPAAIPAVPERLSIRKVDFGTHAVWDMHSDGVVGGVTYAGGFASLPYADLAAYWNSGGLKELRFVPDANAVIDTGGSLYEVYFETADGASLHSIGLEFTAIADQRPA